MERESLNLHINEFNLNVSGSVVKLTFHALYCAVIGK